MRIALLVVLLPAVTGCHLLLPLQPAEDRGHAADLTLDMSQERPRHVDAPELVDTVPSEGGLAWRLAYKLDLANPCPLGLAYSVQAGGCMIDGPGCDTSNVVPIKIVIPGKPTYRDVRGMVRGVQKYSTDAFDSEDYHEDLDKAYVDGVSITVGQPRRHVWTLASGLYASVDSPGSCPCQQTATQPPSFVGESYYCDSGNQGSGYLDKWYVDVNDPLWDTDLCGKPTKNGWFAVTLDNPTDDDLEVRLMCDGCDENIAVTEIELYVR